MAETCLPFHVWTPCAPYVVHAQSLFQIHLLAMQKMNFNASSFSDELASKMHEITLDRKTGSAHMRKVSQSNVCVPLPLCILASKVHEITLDCKTGSAHMRKVRR